MREINVKKITDVVREACGNIACVYSKDILEALHKGRENETSSRSVSAMEMLEQNAVIAEKERIPICQDTGLVIVFLEIGQEVHFVGGNLKDAVQEGVRRGYSENYLRASSVSDPIFARKNTGDNTPAIIYTDIVPGDKVKVEIMAKGFGSENKSALAMLTPADGVEGVKKFVLDTIRKAGPNACPPFIVGVGVGGTFDSCAVMAKKALLRPLSEGNEDPSYRALEEELLKEANELHVGPMGFHGNTTALKIQIEQAPTHIAGLPVAVNMCCHVCRHASEVIE